MTLTDNLLNLWDDACWKLQEAVEDFRFAIDDAKESIHHYWYWNKDLEQRLIQLGVRELFDFDRCFELIGGCDDELIDSNNYHQPQRWELQDFVDNICPEGYQFEGIPVTTIELAEAYFDAKEYGSWLSRAMDPACSDY